MRVIQIDGGSEVVAGPEVQSAGVLYPGERMDMIVQWDPSFAEPNSQLSIKLDPEYDAILFALPILKFDAEILSSKTKP